MAATPTPRRRLFAAAALLFAVFEGNLLYEYAYRSDNLFDVDLPSFWVAARVAFDEGRSPYDYGRMTAHGGEVGRHVFPFLYPPVSLLPLYPLRLASWATARHIVLAANHVLLLGCAGLLLALLLRRDDEPAVVVLALFLAASFLVGLPAINTIVHGQSNLLVLLLLCLAWLGLRGGREVAAGVVLAIAILIKPTPAIFLLYLAARRSWRAFASCSLLLALACVVSVAVLPVDLWWTWLFDVRPSLAYGLQPVHLFSPACPSNQSLNAVVSRLFLEPACRPIEEPLALGGRWIAYGLSLAVVGTSLVAVVKAHARVEPGDAPARAAATDFGFCLFLAAMFLTGSLSWEHHLVFGLPGLALIFLSAVRRPHGRLEAVGLVVAALGILVTLPLSHPSLQQGGAVAFVSIRALAMTVLWSMLRARLDSIREVSRVEPLCVLRGV